MPTDAEDETLSGGTADTSMRTLLFVVGGFLAFCLVLALIMLITST